MFITVEVEIKLNVKPAIEGGPIMLFTKLTMHPALGGHPLGPIYKFEMQDLYYDTADGALVRDGVGLRCRIENGEPRITLKMNKYHDGSLTQREEFEEPLVQERFEWVLSHLSHLIGEGPFSMEAFEAGKPCGPLLPTLTINTARLARPVADMAVLTLDMVEYPGLSAGHYFDIEVGANAGQAGEKIVRAVETDLYRLAGGDLAPAKQSKLERGFTIKAKVQAAGKKG